MARKLKYKDPAGDMAKAELQKIEMYAAKLNDMIHPDDELEAWVQSKLARVATDMGDVKHYLDYEIKKMKDGGMTDDLKLFLVGFKYEKEGDDKDIVRIVKIHAHSKEEAEKIAIEKYEDYYDDFEIVEIEEKQFKYGGEVTALEVLEARNIVGDDSWKKMSRQERVQVTEYLVSKGWIEEEEDELMGMQPEIDIIEASAMQYKKGGRTEYEMDEYNYEREGIEHEMLEFEYKQRNGILPNWFKEMPLKYKRIIIKSKK
jgi:hypothetical protein